MTGPCAYGFRRDVVTSHDRSTVSSARVMSVYVWKQCDDKYGFIKF